MTARDLIHQAIAAGLKVKIGKHEATIKAGKGLLADATFRLDRVPSPGLVRMVSALGNKGNRP